MHMVICVRFVTTALLCMAHPNVAACSARVPWQEKSYLSKQEAQDSIEKLGLTAFRDVVCSFMGAARKRLFMECVAGGNAIVKDRYHSSYSNAE